MSSSKSLRTLSIGLVAFSVIGAAAVMSVQAGPITGPTKGNAAAGKAIYTAKCVACHKADGSGGVKLTGNVTPNWKLPKTWADPARVKGGDDFTRDCIVNGKPKSGMVAWGKTGQLKPAQIEDLIAYINSIAKKK